MRATDLYERPFYRVRDWVAERDPDLAAALDLLARRSHDSVWEINKRRAVDWCLATEENLFILAEERRRQIEADAEMYHLPARSKAA